jgi:hypothetical protein
MSRIGLYYPSVHFRDESWIKLAALYWGKMARMVPNGYELHDSQPIQQLKDDLRFVMDIDPGLVAGRVESSFIELIENYEDVLCPRYLVRNSPTVAQDASIAGMPLMRGRFWSANSADGIRFTTETGSHISEGEFDVAYVACDYFAPDLIDMMVQTGLACRTGGQWRGQRWFALHPGFAAVYMTALAEELAASNDLEPVTDSPVNHLALSGWSMPRLAQALLEDKLFASPQFGEEVTDQLGMLAIESVIPKDLTRIPMSKIIEIRLRYEDALTEFRVHIDELTKGLTSLSMIQDPSVLQAHLEIAFQDTLRHDLERLRVDLRAFGVDTVSAAMNVRVTLPVAAISVAELLRAPLPLNPVAAAGGAIIFSFAEVLRTKRRQAQEHIRSSPSAYLLHVQEELSPTTLAGMISRQIRRFLTGT